MKQVRRPRVAAILSAAAIGICSNSYADQPASQPQSDTAHELQMLRARIDQLEKQQKDQQIKQDAAIQQATVNSVMSDADRKSKLFDNIGISAGYKENRFFIGSDDGNFTLRPWYHLQIRDVTVDRKDTKPSGNDDIENGFEIRRMKIGLDGNMFSPDFTYFFNWATSRANGTANVTNSSGATIGTVSNSLGGVPILEEAWVKYNFHDTPWFVKAGQIKDPLLHDQIVSSRYQQSAERSLTADVFANGDAFTEGITVIYDHKNWLRAEAGVNHGLRSANTNFQDFQTNAYNFGVAGRAEVKVMGRWQDYAQIGAVGTKEPLLVFGIGADSSQRGHATQTVGAADVMYGDPSGFNFYGALVDRYTNHNFGFQTQSGTGASISAPAATAANKATNEYSLLAQGGYNISQHIEPFGRYEYMHVEGTAAGSINYLQVLTAGVNYYFVGHRAKLTAEVQYLPKGIPFADGASDILTSTKGRGEISAELQFQLLL
ncbi:MAG TPA: hypothetical protein VIM11_03850 [Tepidisphaeraceae bacterium]